MIQPNAVEWFYIFVAIITAVLGYLQSSFQPALQKPQPWPLSLYPFDILNPVGHGVFGERPDLLTWVGSAIVVIASGLYTFWRERVRASGEIS